MERLQGVPCLSRSRAGLGRTDVRLGVGSTIAARCLPLRSPIVHQRTRDVAIESH